MTLTWHSCRLWLRIGFVSCNCYIRKLRIQHLYFILPNRLFYINSAHNKLHDFDKDFNINEQRIISNQFYCINSYSINCHHSRCTDTSFFEPRLSLRNQDWSIGCSILFNSCTETAHKCISFALIFATITFPRPSIVTGHFKSVKQIANTCMAIT